MVTESSAVAALRAAAAATATAAATTPNLRWRRNHPASELAPPAQGSARRSILIVIKFSRFSMPRRRMPATASCLPAVADQSPVWCRRLIRCPGDPGSDCRRGNRGQPPGRFPAPAATAHAVPLQAFDERYSPAEPPALRQGAWTSPGWQPRRGPWRRQAAPGDPVTGGPTAPRLRQLLGRPLPRCRAKTAA
jgi:hypothetical protein